MKELNYYIEAIRRFANGKYYTDDFKEHMKVIVDEIEQMDCKKEDQKRDFANRKIHIYRIVDMILAEAELPRTSHTSLKFSIFEDAMKRNIKALFKINNPLID